MGRDRAPGGTVIVKSRGQLVMVRAEPAVKFGPAPGPACPALRVFGHQLSDSRHATVLGWFLRHFNRDPSDFAPGLARCGVESDSRSKFPPLALGTVADHP